MHYYLCCFPLPTYIWFSDGLDYTLPTLSFIHALHVLINNLIYVCSAVPVPALCYMSENIFVYNQLHNNLPPLINVVMKKLLIMAFLLFEIFFVLV